VSFLVFIFVAVEFPLSFRADAAASPSLHLCARCAIDNEACSSLEVSHLFEFPHCPLGKILAGKGGNASIHDNRFVQNESMLLGVLPGGFDLAAFGVTALLVKIDLTCDFFGLLVVFLRPSA
jgi:hypothetical protein